MGDGIQNSVDVRHVAYFSHFIPVFILLFVLTGSLYTFSLTDSRRGTGVSVADREYTLGFPFLFLFLVLLIY